MTTTAEPTTLSVGLAITSRDQITACPIGTILHCSAYTQQRYEKHADGWHVVGENGGTTRALADDHFALDGRNMIETLPSVAQVGDFITTRATYQTLPVGSIVQGDLTWEKINDTQYRNERGTTRNYGQLSAVGGVRVVRVGPAVTPEPDREAEESVITERARETEVPESSETFAQYLQRFRVTVMGQAQRAGVDLHPVVMACEALEVPDFPAPTPGMWAHYSDMENNDDTLPVGTVVLLGSSTGSTNQQCIVGWSGHSWEILLGHMSPYGPGQVLSVPGVERHAWVDEPATDDDFAAIREFKERAWTLGLKAKRENSWCSDYESAMQLMGINEEVATLGRLISAEECAALPVGTILRFVDASNTGSRWFVRDDDAANEAKVRPVGGTLTGTWARSGYEPMTLDEAGEFESQPRVLSHAEMLSMPIGTIIGEPRGSGSRWVKEDADRWRGTTRTAGTGARARDFYISTLHYHVVPS